MTTTLRALRALLLHREPPHDSSSGSDGAPLRGRAGQDRAAGPRRAPLPSRALLGLALLGLAALGGCGSAHLDAARLQLQERQRERGEPIYVTKRVFERRAQVELRCGPPREGEGGGRARFAEDCYGRLIDVFLARLALAYPLVDGSLVELHCSAYPERCREPEELEQVTLELQTEAAQLEFERASRRLELEERAGSRLGAVQWQSLWEVSEASANGWSDAVRARLRERLGAAATIPRCVEVSGKDRIDVTACPAPVVSAAPTASASVRQP